MDLEEVTPTEVGRLYHLISDVGAAVRTMTVHGTLAEVYETLGHSEASDNQRGATILGSAEVELALSNLDEWVDKHLGPYACPFGECGPGTIHGPES